MSDGTLVRGRHEIRKNAAAAVAGGEIQQLADGRAGVHSALDAAVSGQRINLVTEGQFTVPKTASIVVLDGGRVYWDHSANKAHFKPVNDRDFYLGRCVGDAASADTTLVVNLNIDPPYDIDLAGGEGSEWVTEATLGEGVSVIPGGGAKLSFDAVAEIAQAALYSKRTVALVSNPILEARVAIFDIGDNAALDITIGLANGSHATDFQSVTEFVAIHLDGAALSILAESDDGTTDVAPVDTTIDAVDDTEFEVWWDCRDPASCKLYIDGVRALSGTTFVLTAATGPFFPIAHIEKTSDNTLADIRLHAFRVRTAEQ